MPNGEFVEKHEPLPPQRRHVLTAHEINLPISPGPETDENGIPRPRRRVTKARAALARWMYSDQIRKPTVEEYPQIATRDR
jgi:ubiquinol-cytochrome c reductase cytochrome b subunit